MNISKTNWLLVLLLSTIILFPLIDLTIPNGTFIKKIDLDPVLHTTTDSNPLNISVVGSFSKLDDPVQDVCTYGNYIFMVNIGDGMTVFNITNPSAPVEVWDDWAGKWNGLDIVGEQLYVATHGDGLLVYDVQDPTNPLKYGILWMNEEPPYTNPQDVVVRAGYAYLADDFRGLEVVDVQDRSNPVEEGRWNDGGSAKGVAIAGGFVYTIETSGELEVINITSPANPFEVGNVTDGGTGNNIIVNGSYAYIADLVDGLEIVNITSPTNPQQINKFKEGTGSANGVAINGSLIFLADGEDGLEVIDASNPMDPQVIWSYDTVQYATNVVVEGSRIYICEDQGTVEILEVDAPYYPNVSPPETGERPDSRILSDPITITNNQDFEDQGFSGNGSEANPFIIENLYVSSDRFFLIKISDTSCHFIIRNCLLDGVRNNFGAPGIALENVTNGTIMDNEIKLTNQPIVLWYSNENLVFRNYLHDNDGQGIFIFNSHYNIITDNSLIDNTITDSSDAYGLVLYESRNNTFRYNTIENSRLHGLRLQDSLCQNNLVIENVFINNNPGTTSQAYDVGLNNNFTFNYWSDWTTPDNDSDGIVDSPYLIHGGSNSDEYPLTTQNIHVLNPPIVIYPNGGEILSGIVTIEWSPAIDSLAHPIKYLIEYSLDELNWYLISDYIHVYSVSWNTTLLPYATTYSIKITATCGTGLNASDVSNSFFTINKPPESTSTTLSSTTVLTYPEITGSNLSISIIFVTLMLLSISRKKRSK